jgi:hypothetical protein
MTTLAAVITRFEADLHARFGDRLTADQRRALHAMQRCRSAASPMMQLRCVGCEQHTPNRDTHVFRLINAKHWAKHWVSHIIVPHH